MVDSKEETHLADPSPGSMRWQDPHLMLYLSPTPPPRSLSPHVLCPSAEPTTFSLPYPANSLYLLRISLSRNSPAAPSRSPPATLASSHAPLQLPRPLSSLEPAPSPLPVEPAPALVAMDTAAGLLPHGAARSPAPPAGGLALAQASEQRGPFPSAPPHSGEHRGLCGLLPPAPPHSGEQHGSCDTGSSLRKVVRLSPSGASSLRRAPVAGACCRRRFPSSSTSATNHGVTVLSPLTGSGGATPGSVLGALHRIHSRPPRSPSSPERPPCCHRRSLSSAPPPWPRPVVGSWWASRFRLAGRLSFFASKCPITAQRSTSLPPTTD